MSVSQGETGSDERFVVMQPQRPSLFSQGFKIVHGFIRSTQQLDRRLLP
jgi:hypothetical protein